MDQPAPTRFIDYMSRTAQGDLGVSAGSTTTVWDRISATLPVTLSLLLVSMVFAVILGVSAGVIAGLRLGRFIDRAITAATSSALAIPSFLVALVSSSCLPSIDRGCLQAAIHRLPTAFGHGSNDCSCHQSRCASRRRQNLHASHAGALVDTLEQDFIRACPRKGLVGA